MREFRVHPIAWLARFAVTDPIGQDDKKFRRVKRLVFSKQFACELWPDKLRTASGRPVHDQHGIAYLALRILVDFSNGPVVDPQFRQCLAGVSIKIAEYVIVFRRRGIIRRAQWPNDPEQTKE